MRSTGIHVDSKKVRILELDISSKRLLLRGTFEMDRGSGDSLTEILRGYFATAGRPERVVASVGNVPVVVKSFSYPFKDRSEVLQAISAEFEDSLPIKMENFVVEYQLLGREEGLYNFTGAILARDTLEDMNQVFESIDVVPSDFIIPSEALGRLGLSFLQSEFQPGSVICFCDIGFECTQVSVIEIPLLLSNKFKANAYTHSLIDFRHFMRGTRDIYDREGSRRALSVREFEDWLGAEIDFNQKNIDDIKNAVRPLLVEIYQVSQAATSKSGRKIEHFVLTGPLSRCQGFRDFFETELRTPTLIWDPFQSIDLSLAPLTTDIASRFVIPLALSLRHGALKSLPWLNFRRSSKRKQIISAAIEKLSQPEFLSSFVPIFLMSLVIFVISMGANVMMESRVDKQATRTQGALSRAKAPLGSDIENLISSPSEVHEQFEEFKIKNLAKLPSKQTSTAMLEDLLKLSQSLPASVRVDQLKIVASSSGKTLEASLESADSSKFSSEEVVNTLKSKGYSDVTIDGSGSSKQLKMKGN